MPEPSCKTERSCKIVATIGPASASPAMLRQLHATGVDIFRLNFSHGQHDAHLAVVTTLREIEHSSDRPICLLADLQGPKFRCGDLEGGTLSLAMNTEYALIDATTADARDVIPVPHRALLQVLEPGDTVRLDDGKLQLRIDRSEGDRLIATALTPGVLSSRKGINVPGRAIPVSALTDKDRADLDFALEAGVDYVALSFVQRAEDIEEAKSLIGGRAKIISKIEKPTAVDCFADILALTDAVMIARGDLGVELPPENVPIIQRRLVQACRKVGKPVIVATHMLESMVEAPTPTRAEASDVSNAVTQGADGVMLSAESAVGRHPPTAVAIMDRIIKAAEQADEFWETRYASRASKRVTDRTTADSICSAASAITEADDCEVIIAYTSSGTSALRVARERPNCKILAVTPDIQVARQLMLSWGIHPVVSENIVSFEDMMARAEDFARQYSAAQSGDRLVIVAGYPFGKKGSTNTMKISRLP